MVVFVIRRLHVVRDGIVKWRRNKPAPEILALEVDTVNEVLAWKFVSGGEVYEEVEMPKQWIVIDIFHSIWLVFKSFLNLGKMSPNE